MTADQLRAVFSAPPAMAGGFLLRVPSPSAVSSSDEDQVLFPLSIEKLFCTWPSKFGCFALGCFVSCNCFALDREIALHVVLAFCGSCKCSTHDLKK